MDHKYAIELELTDFCSLQCSVCINKNLENKTFLKEKEFYTIINYIKTNKESIYAIDLCGIGDVFLHPEIFNFLEYIRICIGDTIPVIIPTKATLLKKSDFSKLLHLQDSGLRFVISFGFFSMNEQIHDSITGKIGSYKQMINGIQLCRKMGIHFSLELLHNSGSRHEKEIEIFTTFAKKIEVGHRIHEFHNFGGALKTFKYYNTISNEGPSYIEKKYGSFDDDINKPEEDNGLKCIGCMPTICADGHLYFCSAGAKIEHFDLGHIDTIFHIYPDYRDLMKIISKNYINITNCKNCSRRNLIKS